MDMEVTTAPTMFEVAVPGDDVCTTDPALLKAWVAALRSGFYNQGAGALVGIMGGHFVHCCLGVLQDLGKFQRANYTGKGVLTQTGIGEHLGPACGLSPLLQMHLSMANDGAVHSTESREWKDKFPPIIEPGQCHADFRRIADWIESYLLS